MLLYSVKLHAYLSSVVAMNDTFHTEENITSETHSNIAKRLRDFILKCSVYIFDLASKQSTHTVSVFDSLSENAYVITFTVVRFISNGKEWSVFLKIF